METLFLLSYIITEKESAFLMASNENILYMVESLKNALGNSKHMTTKFINFNYSAYEIFRAMSNLANCSDQNIKFLVEGGLLELISKSFNAPEDSTTRFSLEEKTYAAKCCWQICMSGNKNYIEKILKNNELIKGIFLSFYLPNSGGYIYC